MAARLPTEEVAALEQEIAARDAFLARVSASLAAIIARMEDGSATLDELRGFARELAVIAGDDEARAPRRTRVDARRVVESSIGRWRDRTEGRIEIRAEIADGADLEGEWDPDQLGSILGELLSNACKYGAGSPVVVRLEGDASSRVPPTADPPAGTLRLVVEDAGRGIDVDPGGSSRRAAHEVRRFRRGYDAETSALPGFGVGVWLVHELARAHGGSLRLERRREGGTRAVVELPRRSR